MSIPRNKIWRHIKSRADQYINEDYIGEKYTNIYIIAVFIALIFTPYLPPSIGTGLLTAASIFAIHEAVKVRFTVLISILSDIYPDSFTWFTPDSYLFIGGAVLIDLLIAVPMFSPEAYSWSYTLMIITYILMFALYIYTGKFLLRIIKDAIEKNN